MIFVDMQAGFDARILDVTPDFEKLLDEFSKVFGRIMVTKRL